MPGEDLTLDDGVHYSFALEYSGPPLCRDLPRALPINLRHIPVAAVVSQVSLADKLSLPVVHPIVPLDPLPLKFSRELNPPQSTVSPTSVIQICALDSDSTTVSPTSVIPLEDRSRDDKLSDELSCSGPLHFSNGNYVSGELSDSAALRNSNALASCSISHDHSSELFGGAHSSSTLDFCDSFDKSRESSSCVFRASTGVKDSVDLNQPDWASNESILSMDYPSSRVSLRQTQNEAAITVDSRRNPAVTFRDIESDDGNDEFSRGELEDPRPKRDPPVRGKKGSCYRCFKGSRFTEKEVCIVCDAKYCGNCVLRAMGSMPEGRKCVPCIGYPISESQRGNLGKCSRLLKRLLSDLEVREIMKAEKSCEANQLQPEYVRVNGQPLSHEELNILQTCANPPKKLKPGNYWYDKVSGLWGKDGQKPTRIISPHLHVGGPVRPDASNGNTQVYINGREITKVELRMLQLAGVQCAGNPHFWVNEDGSYQEEGQKNTKGYIWGKPGTKLLCAFLSLPVPSKSSNSFGEQASNSVSRSVPDYFGQRMIQKILLVGNSGSGTSTIFKQAKILYKDIPFSSDEREDIKLTIQSNVYRYLGILLEGRERFEEEHLSEVGKSLASNGTDSSCSGGTDERHGYFIGSRLKAFSDWLLKAMAAGNLEVIFPAASREYAPLVEELWRDSAVQATYKRRNELDTLPSVANYFLERAVDILRDDYDPSDLDILYAEGVMSSNGLGYVDFSFPQCPPEDSSEGDDAAELQDSLLRYQLIRLQGRGLGENCKWLEMFDDIGMVMFCVSLSEYDEYSVDATSGCMGNSMMLSRRLFESIVTNPTFEQMDFLLVLNKFDIFEDKVERIPLTQCEWFDDFNPVVSRSNKSNKSNNINCNPSLGQLGFHYIAVKFKRLYYNLTGGRKLYVSGVKALEPASVDAALKYGREILKWDEERGNFSLSECNSTEEASSWSH